MSDPDVTRPSTFARFDPSQLAMVFVGFVVLTVLALGGVAAGRWLANKGSAAAQQAQQTASANLGSLWS